MTRRSFHQITSSSALAFGAQANSAMTIGLLGCGERGTTVGAMMARDDRVRFTGLCDVNAKNADSARGPLRAAGARHFQDYRELLNSNVDAVLIATPVYLHPEHFEAAVQAGKHIYCEKPMGVDAPGCLRVMAAAKKAAPKQVITIGLQNRYGPGYLKAEKLIRENVIGPIRMARSNWIASTGIGKRKRAVVPPEREKLIYWHHWREYSGDMIVEQDVHGIDTLNWFLGGPPMKAHGSGGRIMRTYGDTLDHLNVTFTYPTGVQAVLTASQFGPNGYRVVSETFIETEGVIETTRQSLWVYRNEKDQTTEKIPKNITENAAENFVARVIERRPENRAITAAESTLTAILGRMAIEQKREVLWREIR